jgi:hypothetical protein
MAEPLEKEPAGYGSFVFGWDVHILEPEVSVWWSPESPSGPRSPQDVRSRG